MGNEGDKERENINSQTEPENVSKLESYFLAILKQWTLL